MLLKHPNIDVTIKNNEYKNFIDYINDKSIFKNYYLQKKILNNNREDILVFLNKYGLINDKIKEEVPELFKASEWGLI
jgi:hypothetical protein